MPERERERDRERQEAVHFTLLLCDLPRGRGFAPVATERAGSAPKSDALMVGTEMAGKIVAIMGWGGAPRLANACLNRS